MKRYVVLGVNENPKYLYYLPLVYWAWLRFTWTPLIIYARRLQFPILRDMEALTSDTLENIGIDFFPRPRFITELKYPTETLAQVSRLYACLIEREPSSMLMTSDMDMLPLSNYWNPSDLNITCYGRDLTDYHYPICYCAMTSRKWHEVMMMTDSDYQKCIIEDLDERPKNTNPWLWDQDILTERLNRYGKRLLTLVHRGTDKRTGYPIGRVDRSHWTLDHKTLIDAHLPHDVLTNEKSFHNVMNLLHTVWPKQDWKWFLDYTKNFKKLL